MNKAKVKFIILILAFLLMLCVFNINTVNAATLEDLQKMLDLIPDEIYLDIPEIEYEKANDLIKEQAEKILKDNGIDTEKYEIISYQRVYATMEGFYNPQIVIRDKENNLSKNKNIKVTFNNTDKVNSTDEQYVKNLKLENPRYFEVNLDTGAKNEDIWNWTKKFLENYYSNIINDNSVTLRAFIGSGAGNGLGWGTAGGGLYLNIFKNGKLYDVKDIGEMSFVPVININSSINLKEAVINEVKKYYPDYAKLITSVEKGITDENMVNIDRYQGIKDLYTIKVSANEVPNSLVIIRQTDSSLQIKDEATNIKIDTDATVLPANTKLVVNELKEGETYKVAEKLLTNEVDKMYVYDITLENEGVEIQPNGKVKVSIPIPEGVDTSKLVVYRIDDEENKTEYEVKVETIDNVKYATFETDHFSTYVLAEEKTEQNTTNENVSEVKGEKDNTPKTGTANTTLGMIALVSIIGIGTIVLIKKHK